MLIDQKYFDYRYFNSLLFLSFYFQEHFILIFLRFHEKSGNHTRALKLYIQGGEKYMDSAIQMIGHASNEHLTNTLLNYLMGITDGIPKDPIFTYKVYR